VSAANWRGAMNYQSRTQSPSTPTASAPAASAPRPPRPRFRNPVRLRHVIVLAFLIAYPWFAPPFFTFQIGAQSLALGLIALSLTFLGGFGGMISLAQMTVAGIAGYMVAIFGTAATDGVTLGWPWWLAVLIGIVLATLAAAFIGWLSVRTEGIYTIMITLAIGVGFYYLVLQNYAVFNGFQGEQKVFPPTLAGIYWRDPTPFYYLTLFWALVGYLFVVYLLRSPFGIALQGIRDNPRRMHALGFNVTAHRVAAYAVAGAIAAVGGVLFTWYNGLVTPGSVGTSWLINILIIAVLGGMRHPVGAFLGAIVFVLLQNFAIDVIDRERFNLVIGVVFLVIVLFSRDGLLGWWSALSARLSTQRGETRWSSARRRLYAR
jgi:branched-chain amino acid transport system permease protein